MNFDGQRRLPDDFPVGMDDERGVGAKGDPASLQKEDGRMGGMSAFVDGGKEFDQPSFG